ncbi:glycogen/starch/alpha-glucan phosphorylase [uncultured Ilyobacter sp.]|uniref:glycogen/starch/alpha-glucan phosphorylase n=1 Tax=uncultured Ilyobacter sp. TaxID=544433 RepID=UPI0029F49B3B|nr:glycogen/starch/alpha-glucan phosphorylase [uncultured Ilyobacter sp.]
MSTRPRKSRPSSTTAATRNPLIARFLHHLRFTQGEAWVTATPHDHFVSLALAVRDRMIDRMVATQRTYHRRDVKRVYYLSLEYLLGRSLRNNLVCLGLYESCREDLAKLDIDLERVCDLEPDAGLGNGGLGRLAACYLDSAATLQLPVYGYGIRYEYGIFEQEIANGWQVEHPDYWLRFGTPWEVPRPEFTTAVRLYGRLEDRQDKQGRYRPAWVDYRTVMGLPYDMPIVGYGVNTVNILRLWSARASHVFDLAAFNRGGYVEAVREKAVSETISKVLYPSDELESGKELRLQQQYFFVACTLSDIIRRYEKTHDHYHKLPHKIAIQLNDTHPALAIAEMMRLLIDERGMDWDPAWEITQKCFAYTNHTLLPEALEVWPVSLLGRVLPRHLQIIFEINKRFLEQVELRWPGDSERQRDVSLVQEMPEKAIRMANLSIVGSHSVNGVAALHTDLIRSRLVPRFAEMWPDKFINHTNGITPRRWLRACNEPLSHAISERIGDDWISNLDDLRKLEAYADDSDFQDRFIEAKVLNKQRFADWCRRRMGIQLNTNALFDVQVKRLHEYKRQLMNILQVIMRYQRLLDDPGCDLPPRVVLFGAKAAPAYSRAKLIIKLINDVAYTINHDQRVNNRLKVLFVPNYCVSLAELVIPAADLSEQISTAGMEASGTGNMKLALNGALTIGTLDGANIEIRDAVGEENFFLFGLTAEQVAEQRPTYDPWTIYNGSERISRALHALTDGTFNSDRPDLFAPIFDWLTHERDFYMIMADMESYLAAQDQVDARWHDTRGWARSAILNVARVGYFSSDRAVWEYATETWGVKPIAIRVPAQVRSHLPPASGPTEPTPAIATVKS